MNNENNKHYVSTIVLVEELDKLRDRISKAIEYIESYMPNYDFDKTNLTKVLDILKGGKDNE